MRGRLSIVWFSAGLTAVLAWLGCAGAGVSNSGGVVLVGGSGQSSFAGAGGSGGSGGSAGIGGIGGSGGTGGGGGATGPFTLTTSSFTPGGSIPAACASVGGQPGAGRQNISPSLQWTGVPAGTQELVVIVTDQGFMHWAAWGIPANATGLPQGVPPLENPNTLPGMVQGANDFGTTGYGGPDPPAGEVHTYEFLVYALPAPLGLPPGTPAGQVLIAVQGNPFASFTGTFP